MSRNATVKILPNGTLEAVWDGEVVARGWMVVDVEQLDDGEPAVIRLLFAGRKVETQ
jgi:hypothetical protein